LALGCVDAVDEEIRAALRSVPRMVVRLVA
jgi:hypothetical protein